MSNLDLGCCRDKTKILWSVFSPQTKKKTLIMLETFCQTPHKQNRFQQLKETKARLKNTSKKSETYNK